MIIAANHEDKAMDLTVVIAGNFAARNLTKEFDENGEDKFYDTFGKDHLSVFKLAWARLRCGATKVSNFLRGNELPNRLEA